MFHNLGKYLTYYTEKVVSIPDIVDSISGFVDIFLKVLTIALAKP